MSIYYLIFGCGVYRDRRPSGTMIRRVQGALAAARGQTGARFMPTGGSAASGHVEAEVMRELLVNAGVAPERIIVEAHARDTLEAVRLCDSLLRGAGDVDWVTPCTSFYHVPRCALLLRLLGWRVKLTSMPSDLGELSRWRLLLFSLKELVALPYDVMLLLLDRQVMRR